MKFYNSHKLIIFLCALTMYSVIFTSSIKAQDYPGNYKRNIFNSKKDNSEISYYYALVPVKFKLGNYKDNEGKVTNFNSSDFLMNKFGMVYDVKIDDNLKIGFSASVSTSDFDVTTDSTADKFALSIINLEYGSLNVKARYPVTDLFSLVGGGKVGIARLIIYDHGLGYTHFRAINNFAGSSDYLSPTFGALSGIELQSDSLIFHFNVGYNYLGNVLGQPLSVYSGGVKTATIGSIEKSNLSAIEFQIGMGLSF